MMKQKEIPYINPADCAGCSVCVENCPMGCLRIEDPAYHGDIHTKAVLDESGCIGCGFCAKVCPIRAITMDRGKDSVKRFINTAADRTSSGRISRHFSGWKFSRFKGAWEGSCGTKLEGSIHMDEQWSLKKVYCRGFQSVMKVGMYVLPWRVPKLLKGPGAVKRLPEAIRKKGFQKPLIVTDSQLLKQLHLLDDLLKAMEQAGLSYAAYDRVAPNPTDLNVEEGVAIYKENGCDCMIAFGGGSPMDCAKGIGARITRPGRSVRQLQGLFRVLLPIPVIFAVPTTAGTGSETTIAAVITESATHHKASMNDLCLMPKYAVLDPELTVDLPPHVTATTGMDALCHAVEAYTNHTYNSALEKKMCRKAVKLIYDNLPVIYRDGSNLKAREHMQKAAFYAGRAFTRGSVGYVHAIGHTLGGLYGTPHGLAMSILLPHVMRAYGEAAQERLAELCDVCGIKTVDDSVRAKAESFIRWIEDLKEEMQIPVYPEMILEKDVDQIVEWAEKEGNPLYPTPQVWRKKEFREFILSVTPRFGES